MKLINTTIRPLIVYALFIFALSVPAYFFLLNAVWSHELDSHHKAIKKRISTELNELRLSNDELDKFLITWNKVEQGVHILPEKSALLRDSFYTTTGFDKYHDEIEKFRCLQTSILLNKDYYRLSIQTNMEETDETFYMVAILSLLFFLLMLGGFVWITRKYSRKIWLPFYETLKTLRAFDIKHNRSINLTEASIDEFKELNNSIAELTHNSVTAYRTQKEFTENASHELQTPVAVLKSKIDLLLQDPALTLEQADSISQLLQPISRLSHINRNLLLFAKIENYNHSDEEDIDVGTLLTKLIEQVREYTSAEIEFSSTGELTLKANTILVEIMLNNLLVNAVRYGGNKKITTDLQDNRLTVSNNGETTLDTDKLFKRYISASPDSPGSGLGLAIVAEICQKYSWKYSYEFTGHEHKFSIIF